MQTVLTLQSALDSKSEECLNLEIHSRKLHEMNVLLENELYSVIV